MELSPRARTNTRQGAAIVENLSHSTSSSQSLGLRKPIRKRGKLCGKSGELFLLEDVKKSGISNDSNMLRLFPTGASQTNHPS